MLNFFGGLTTISLSCDRKNNGGKDLHAFQLIVRGDRDSRATLMPIYGDLYQIKV